MKNMVSMEFSQNESNQGKNMGDVFQKMREISMQNKTANQIWEQWSRVQSGLTKHENGLT